MLAFLRSSGPLVAVILFLHAFADNAEAASVNTQSDGTINSINGLLIGANEYVDVVFGVTLAGGETTCMLGPGCQAGIYVVALNEFLNADGFESVRAADGSGGGLYRVLTPATRLEYIFDGGAWRFSQSGLLAADRDIRFTASAVPLPGAFGLFAATIAGLGWFRTRRGLALKPPRTERVAELLG